MKLMTWKKAVTVNAVLLVAWGVCALVLALCGQDAGTPPGSFFAADDE
jgi:hypothetical protein